MAKKKDPYEVFKALGETNALLEEGVRSTIERVVAESHARTIAFCERMWKDMIQARVESVERIYREEAAGRKADKR